MANCTHRCSLALHEPDVKDLSFLFRRFSPRSGLSRMEDSLLCRCSIKYSEALRVTCRRRNPDLMPFAKIRHRGCIESHLRLSLLKHKQTKFHEDWSGACLPRTGRTNASKGTFAHQLSFENHDVSARTRVAYNLKHLPDHVRPLDSTLIIAPASIRGFSVVRLRWSEQGLGANCTMSLPSPPDSSVSEAGSSKKEETGDYLESLAKSILEINLNQKDSDHPLIIKHMSPQFRGKHDALPKATTRNEHQDNLKKHLAAQPDFHVIILNSSSEVDDSRGRATVYLWYEISGLSNGLEREAVAVLSWERRQGIWMVVKHQGMRGPAGFQ